MILLIDNYDSFTYNLYQALAVMDEVRVIRNDLASVRALLRCKPSHIVLSPGPKTPDDSGICIDLVRAAAGRIPILGVCLGHQILGKVFGGGFGAAREIRHGKTSEIFHNGGGIFEGLPNPFTATRYHSLAVTDPGELHVTARTADHEIMALRHPSLPIFGVQFHPESILTPAGPKLLENFLRLSKPGGPRRIAA